MVKTSVEVGTSELLTASHITYSNRNCDCDEFVVLSGDGATRRWASLGGGDRGSHHARRKAHL